jgi:TonB family protein
MAQSVNAHPMASPRTDARQAIDAPSLEAIPASGSADSGAVPGIIGSNSAAPAPPEVKPEAEIKVGGQVTEPVLVSKVAPVYPVIAKEAGIAGDVVIKTNLDKNGNVIHMEVVSGPSMLRQPALEALRRWKYKPSTLNGEPVPVTILVTLKFHR